MRKKIRKILIANRGEVACRIIRSCQEMDIKTVSVYSKVDQYAPFVRQADEAYLIGEATATESYLNQEKIIEIAKHSHSDAIHPGYGFLSENPSFVDRVEQEGLIFIGPSTSAIHKLGSKTAARSLAKSLGIPIIPGTINSVENLEEARAIIRKIKYPILLKASGGGGGKGMKIVNSDAELSSCFRSAQSEAKASFGDSRIYIEKYLKNPHHIEIQILADTRGTIIHLGERECSIQRRHQKIIEESPSISITKGLRDNLFHAAVELVRSANYVNAGTVEFLVDAGANYYFLEMNTRLQVEHPVTEMRTGIDIVREQIMIAECQPLRYRQKDIVFHGHSIECRIYAEDPTNNFFPCIGNIVSLSTPGGFGIREDSGIEEGSDITPFYDPLLSKLIVWGINRTEALARMSRALHEYKLYGVKNNLSLCQWIINHPKFKKGNYNTHFLENNFDANSLPQPTEELLHQAAILAILLEQQLRISPNENRTALNKSQWYKKRTESMR